MRCGRMCKVSVYPSTGCTILSENFSSKSFKMWFLFTICCITCDWDAFLAVQRDAKWGNYRVSDVVPDLSSKPTGPGGITGENSILLYVSGNESRKRVKMHTCKPSARTPRILSSAFLYVPAGLLSSLPSFVKKKFFNYNFLFVVVQFDMGARETKVII